MVTKFDFLLVIYQLARNAVNKSVSKILLTAM